MSAEIGCPSCQRRLRIPPQLLGKRVKCPNCLTVIQTSAETASAPPWETASAPPSPPPDQSSPLGGSWASPSAPAGPAPAWGPGVAPAPGSPTAAAGRQGLHWYLILPAALSLGVPLLALAGGWCASGLALIVVAVCVSLALVPSLKPSWRAAGSWGTLGLGYLVALILVVVALVGWVRDLQRLKWQDYTSVQGRYSVRMPGTPRETVQQTSQAPGVRINVTEVLLPVHDLGFYVHYFDLPNAIPPQAEDQFYDQLRGNILSDFPGGRVAGEQRVVQNGAAGREFIIDMPRSVRVIRRIFVRGDRCYLVTVSGSGAKMQSSDPDIRQFFDSFQLH